MLKTLTTLIRITYQIFLSAIFDKGATYSTKNSVNCVSGFTLHFPTYSTINKYPLVMKYTLTGIFNLRGIKPKLNNVGTWIFYQVILIPQDSCSIVVNPLCYRASDQVLLTIEVKSSVFQTFWRCWASSTFYFSVIEK